MGAFVLLMIITGVQSPVVHEVGRYTHLDKCKTAALWTVVMPRTNEPAPAMVFVCVPAGDSN